MIIAYILGINALTFIFMGLDKQKAKRQTRRIPEKLFFGLAVLGGSAGVWIGMKHFRHKTRHWSFTIGIPFLIMIQLVAMIFIKFVS